MVSTQFVEMPATTNNPFHDYLRPDHHGRRQVFYVCFTVQNSTRVQLTLLIPYPATIFGSTRPCSECYPDSLVRVTVLRISSLFCHLLFFIPCPACQHEQIPIATKHFIIPHHASIFTFIPYPTSRQTYVVFFKPTVQAASVY